MSKHMLPVSLGCDDEEYTKRHFDATKVPLPAFEAEWSVPKHMILLMFSLNEGFISVTVIQWYIFLC